MLGAHRVAGGRDGGRIGEVEDERHGAPADLARDLGQTVGVAVDQDQAEPLRGQRAGDGAADAAGGAGEETEFVFKGFHRDIHKIKEPYARPSSPGPGAPVRGE